MKNQKWRLLKELPDVEIGSIGFEEGGYVKFKNEINEYVYYNLSFVQSKPDWFEEVESLWLTTQQIENVMAFLGLKEKPNEGTESTQSQA